MFIGSDTSVATFLESPKQHRLKPLTDMLCILPFYQGYQFWTTTDEDGYFVITNVRAGSYNLYGLVHGFIGDYKYEVVITITEGSI